MLHNINILSEMPLVCTILDAVMMKTLILTMDSIVEVVLNCAPDIAKDNISLQEMNTKYNY